MKKFDSVKESFIKNQVDLKINYISFIIDNILAVGEKFDTNFLLIIESLCKMCFRKISKISNDHVLIYNALYEKYGEPFEYVSIDSLNNKIKLFSSNEEKNNNIFFDVMKDYFEGISKLEMTDQEFKNDILNETQYTLTELFLILCIYFIYIDKYFDDIKFYYLKDLFENTHIINDYFKDDKTMY